MLFDAARRIPYTTHSTVHTFVLPLRRCYFIHADTLTHEMPSFCYRQAIALFSVTFFVAAAVAAAVGVAFAAAALRIL